MRAIIIRLNVVALCSFSLLSHTNTAKAAPSNAQPRLQAKAAIAIEASTGLVLYQKNANQRQPIASTTKMMTALLTIERASLTTKYPAVSYPVTTAESTIGLQAGEQLTVADLLRGLLLASGNDAAATLATGVSGSKTAFVNAMNQRAKQLKLKTTHYSTPIGLDNRKNFSSAADLATLTRILLRKKFLRETVNLKTATLRSGSKKRKIFNRNTLVQSIPWVNGVKTGHTSQAGYVLVASGTKKRLTFVSAVLGTPSEAIRNREALLLLKYAAAHTEEKHILNTRRPIASTSVRFQPKRQAVLVPEKDFTQVMRSKERVEVKVTAVKKDLKGPLAAGTRAGTATVMINGHKTTEVPLVTTSAIPKASISQRLAAVFKEDFVRVLLAILLLSIIGLTFLAIGARKRRKAFKPHPVPR